MILPETQSLLNPKNFETSVQPSKTYAVNFDKNSVSGYLDGKEALCQTIRLTLSIERFTYPIYSSDYGVEFNVLYGKPLDYVLARLEGEITDALLVDDRIFSVKDFSYELSGDIIHAFFTVVSDFGDINAETEVTI